ncbi:hypothetical protein SAMN02745166_00032 [Prosthecobacter debontii]|uniref:Phospholipase_D-nuclease N-terminal n=1 Tax=Prosthecobacter debontii TaxID=48467 RepID=A0A1T4WDT2_9BACT|nr:hypothetical protein [Prosthecobacter debontii]SKA75482.1 hypothetical protein SAMN02745166_00032 [Prosthecobacter debontii]
MIPFNFTFPNSSLFALVLMLLWLVYMALYWRAMVQILRASKFDSQDKILWFLVITLAPVLGLITFHAMCPPPVRESSMPPTPPAE